MGDEMQGSYIKESNNTNQGYKQYVVQKDDSLYKIAKEHNTTVDDLIKINHLPSNTIYPNQILFIPLSSVVSGDFNKTYMTKDGESIEDILKKFKISMKDLEKYNDIEKLKLNGNQLLYIDRVNNCCHMTVRGNISIEDVLSRYNLSPLEFLKLNEQNILKDGSNIKIK